MLIPENYRPWIYLAGAFAVYLLIMFTNPARKSLRDGFRCLGRYWRIWVILMLFGLCSAIFLIWVDWHEHLILAEGMRPDFIWYRPWFLPERGWSDVLRQSVLPSLECVAGLFNVFVTMFPFSAVASLLFLVNWDGHHAVLFRALRRRFGIFGIFLHAGILVCAAAAIVKPFIYGPLLLQHPDFISDLSIYQWSFVVDWLSFLFEIMFGTAVQIYLILMVYSWVRGLKFTHRHLIDFAIRRFSYVMKWSVVVMLVSTAFLYAPRIASNFPPFTHYLSLDRILNADDRWVHPAITAFLLVFCSMQIVLTFHGESLGKAVRDHFRFIGREWWSVGWFLLVAFVHIYFLSVLNTATQQGFGRDTGPVLAWSVFYPLVYSLVGGWLLASWVCLYKRSETGRMRDENWIQY